MSGPYYGCDVGDCAQECTHEASDLRLFRGKLVCDGCWDYKDEIFDDLPDDEELPIWNELEKFKPELELEEYKDAIGILATELGTMQAAQQTTIEELVHDNTRLHDTCTELATENSGLIEALTFYANPDSYHAIMVVGDRPCGEFADDFSDADDWVEFAYDRPMPGAKARAILKRGD